MCSEEPRHISGQRYGNQNSVARTLKLRCFRVEAFKTSVLFVKSTAMAFDLKGADKKAVSCLTASFSKSLK